MSKFITFLESKGPVQINHGFYSYSGSGAIQDFLSKNRVQTKTRIDFSKEDKKPTATFGTNGKYSINVYLSYSSDKFVRVNTDSLSMFKNLTGSNKPEIMEKIQLEVLRLFYNQNKIPNRSEIIDYIMSNGDEFIKRARGSYYDSGVDMITALKALKINPTGYSFFYAEDGVAGEIITKAKALNKIEKAFGNMNRWNPADVFIIKDSEISKIGPVLRSIQSFNELNSYLSDALEDKRIIPVSLKSISSGDYRAITVNKLKSKCPIIDQFVDFTLNINKKGVFIAPSISIILKSKTLKYATKMGYYPKKGYFKAAIEGSGSGHQTGVFSDDFYTAMKDSLYNPTNVRFIGNLPKAPKVTKKMFETATKHFIDGASKTPKTVSISYAEFQAQDHYGQLVYLETANFLTYLMHSGAEFSRLAQKASLCLFNPSAAPYVIFK